MLNALLRSAIALGFAAGPFATYAQVVQVLPAPGTPLATNSEQSKIAYTIEKGMPYSGVWVTKHVTKFPDGQILKDENTRKVWRDSDGRTREDTTWTRRSGVLATVCRIEDPVGHVRYIWRIEPGRETVITETHFTMDKYAVTEVWPNPPSHPIESPPGATIVILKPPRSLNSDSKEEKLGPTYMNGVYAEGTRSVEPIPAGQGSNQSDHTIYRIDETWFAPDLDLFIKSYLEDGFGFTEDSELKDIDRSEPDPSTFLPPSDLPIRVAPESDPAWSEPYGSD